MNFENFKEKNKIRWYQLDDLKCEEWVDIKDYEGMYKVSNYGRVKSMDRVVSNGKAMITKYKRILKQWKDSNNRFIIDLNKNNKRIKFSVSRLVLQNFISSCPNGMECCHNNGICLDNRLKNLRWDSHKNNEADKIKHGTTCHGHKHSVGIKNGSAKLSEKQVCEIKELLKTKEYTQKEIGEMYNVAQRQISCIKNKRTWKHINLS